MLFYRGLQNFTYACEAPCIAHSEENARAHELSHRQERVSLRAGKHPFRVFKAQLLSSQVLVFVTGIVGDGLNDWFPFDVAEARSHSTRRVGDRFDTALFNYQHPISGAQLHFLSRAAYSYSRKDILD